MACVKTTFIISFVVAATFFVTVSTLGTKTMKVEVTRNGSSIPWDNELSQQGSDKFKQLAQKVRNKLREDLGHLKGISKIKVKNFQKTKNGNLSCLFEYKVDSMVSEEGINITLNGTVDIGVIASVTFITISMDLQLKEAWIDNFRDKDSKEYQNLSRRIKDALEEIYQNTGDVEDFEIDSLKSASDGSVLVALKIIVHPDSKLTKENLETIFNEFTRKNSFGGMTIAKEERESEATIQTDGFVTGFLVIGALMISAVIIGFFVKVLMMNWRHKVESHEDYFEAKYQQAETLADVASLSAPTNPRGTSAMSISRTSDSSISL